MQADRTVEKRMAEMAQRAQLTGIAQITGFLTPAEQAQAEICARQAGAAYYAQGGTPGAERRVAAFTQDEPPEAWPVLCLRAAWHARYGAPGHRDFLGAILALGISRENVGDLYISQGQAYIFALKDMAGYIAANLERAGNVPVTLQVLDEWPALDAEEGTPLRATVSSLRLDALLAAAWRLSRTKASQLVSSGRVQVDHRPELRCDRMLGEGAVISVRGMGRLRLHEVGAMTKKGRISVVLLRY